MKAQTKLDFLMKFFISVVAVILIVLSIYYFGSTFTKNVFNAPFKIPKPGVRGGNLNVKYKLLYNKTSVITYKQCISNCNNGQYSHLVPCAQFCSMYCNVTDSVTCNDYFYLVYLFVPYNGNAVFFVDGLGQQQFSKKLRVGQNKVPLHFLGIEGNSKIEKSLEIDYLGTAYQLPVNISKGCAPLGDSCKTNSDCCTKGSLYCGNTFIVSSGSEKKVDLDSRLSNVILNTYATGSSNSCGSCKLTISCGGGNTINVQPGVCKLNERVDISKCSGEEVTISAYSCDFSVTVQGTTSLISINPYCDEGYCNTSKTVTCEVES